MTIDLKSFIAEEKVIHVNYPAIPSWKIELAFLSREKTQKIASQCSAVKFSKITHQREEVTDNEKFLKLYTEQIIRGWSGLKIKHLSILVPVDENAVKGKSEEDVEFSPENAYLIMTNSIEFDRFISDTLRNVEEFNTELKSTTGKN